ncbi:MAG: hypothetical protein CL610_11715 [Anaerolineaceae bacterium]|nr:hypothetical protein [Anaerolineaceae bacterium]
MTNKNNIPALIRQLEIIYQDFQSRSRQAKQIEKELQFLYDDLCESYLTATSEQRADVCIALEFRERLINQLLVYYRHIANQTEKSVAKKRQESAVRQLVQQGVAARALIGRRVPEEDLEVATRQIAEAAEAIHFDHETLAEDLDVSYKYFVQRAIQYHKGKDRIRALKALGMALQQHPTLERNDHVLALASTLTGETELSAVLTLSDRYVLYKFVQELEEAEARSHAAAAPPQRSTLATIRSWFTN